MEMGLGINTRNQISTCTIINLKLNLGDGSLYGNANINNESSFEINIQEGINSTIIIPEDLNTNPGQAEISFNTENGKRIIVKSNVKKEDTDMIQIFTNLDTLDPKDPKDVQDSMRLLQSNSRSIGSGSPSNNNSMSVRLSALRPFGISVLARKIRPCPSLCL
jgi:hypothetical protein